MSLDLTDTSANTQGITIGSTLEQLGSYKGIEIIPMDGLMRQLRHRLGGLQNINISLLR